MYTHPLFEGLKRAYRPELEILLFACIYHYSQGHVILGRVAAARGKIIERVLTGYFYLQVSFFLPSYCVSVHIYLVSFAFVSWP